MWSAYNTSRQRPVSDCARGGSQMVWMMMSVYSVERLHTHPEEAGGFPFVPCINHVAAV
jgi:hypothetical protein